MLRKELIDALRDRRTLMTVLVSSVLLGPLVLLGVSGLVASLESRAELREVYVAGVANAPTLHNFLERQTYTVKTPPADYEAQLRKSTLRRSGGGGAGRLRGRARARRRAGASRSSPTAPTSAPRRRRRGSSGCSPASAASARCSTWRCAASRLQVLEPMRVDERDLANQQTRATRITGMLPYFVMMAVLYGALTAALDTTAGERERGSLEPLLMNPAERWALVRRQVGRGGLRRAC